MSDQFPNTIYLPGHTRLKHEAMVLRIVQSRPMLEKSLKLLSSQSQLEGASAAYLVIPAVNKC